MKTQNTEILVIGAGVAGLALALKMAETCKIILLSKYSVHESSSSLAQGGIAAVFRQSDTFEKHIQDTIDAGAGLCRPEVVENIILQGPDRIKDLIDWGVEFDKALAKDAPDVYDLTREGGHRESRILHVKDHTGNSIHDVLLKRASEHPNISLLQNHLAIDLLTTKKVDPFSIETNTCLGAYVFNTEKREVIAIKAKATVLATGGAGRVYLYTSNWNGATGDGIAMAFRAGARVANLEFMQFHPTCLYHPQARNFLISEALRGEGAKLLNFHGEEFMAKYHPMGNLAPRDIVARSMDAEIKKSGHPHIHLDISHKPSDWIKDRFPLIYSQCLKFGIDISKQPIPVVPAAHYLCGGVVSDIWGKTEIRSLLVIGESACNGLHGANRLASNSLLECLATAHNSSKYLHENLAELNLSNLEISSWQNPPEPTHQQMVIISHLWQEVRTLMWNYMGIVRSTVRLQRALKRLEDISHEVEDYYRNTPLHQDIIECRNIALVALLSVRCALQRKDSIGIHYNIDLATSHKTHNEDSVIFARD